VGEDGAAALRALVRRALGIVGPRGDVAKLVQLRLERGLPEDDAVRERLRGTVSAHPHGYPAGPARSVPPCARCGTSEAGACFDGRPHRHRRSGARFGVDGLLCVRCWWRLYGQRVLGRVPRSRSGPRCPVVYAVCADCGRLVCARRPGRKRCPPCAEADRRRRWREAGRRWRAANPGKAREVARAAQQRHDAKKRAANRSTGGAHG
jgi:hypothetical protein